MPPPELVLITIGDGERVQKNSDIGGHIEDLNGAIAVDLKAAGQRRGVNGEVRIDRQRVAQRDGRAGQARVKRDDRAAGGIGDGRAQCAGAAVGAVGDHLRRGRGPTGQNQHEQGRD